MSTPLVQIPANTLVLITGATGFTGSVLARKLVSAGVRVRAIARKSSDLAQFKDLNIEWFQGNVYDEQVVARAAKDVSYIFHLAAAYREAKLADQDYYNVHVASTRLLAEAAVKNPHFQRFVHISTIGVHGHIDHPPADESYRFAPGDIYQSTKAEAELWLRNFATKNNLPFVIIRPAGIYGPGDRRLLKIFKMAAKPFFPLLGRGKFLYHLVHVEDLTNVILLAATHPRAEGDIFICGNVRGTSLIEMGQIAAKTLGRKFRAVRLPVWPFYALATVCEWICKPFGIEPPLYRRRVAFFTKDRAFDTRRLREKLGYEMIYSNEDGLAETGEWYLKQGWLKRRAVGG